MFEPLVAPSPAPAYEAPLEEYDHHDDGQQRSSGPLGRLLDLARGGFSHRPSSDDVHEAEHRQTSHEPQSGFDRLATQREAPAHQSRGLNTGSQRPALTSITTTPTDNYDLDVDESEMNIPAFLRRQMN